MKYLSIIIPHYSETEKQMFNLMSSIHNQVGVDFDDIEVIIANDGGHVDISETWLQQFCYKTRQVYLDENLGPGMARQKGIDASKAEYVMFCDADDVLHSIGVIGSFLEVAQNEAPDMIISSWLEEMYNEELGRMIYFTHNMDNTWMHGKMFRRQFLTRNNIRFDERLRVHEDSYFLALCANLTNRRIAMNPQILTYMWRYQDGSITRHNEGAYSYDSISVFIEAITQAHKELEKRGLPKERMQICVSQLCMYLYFMLHSPAWLASPYLAETEMKYVECVKPLWHYFVEAPEELIVQHYKEEREKHFSDCVEGETLTMWLDRLGLEQNKGKPIKRQMSSATKEKEEHMPYVNENGGV